MGSIITRAKRIKRARFITQISALILLNLQFLNIWLPNLQLAGMRVMCAPVFFCHSCPWATFACPLGVLINFSALRIFPLITLAILGLVGTLGGRLVCGWVCPFGWLQDMLHKIPTKKFSIPAPLKYTKYVLLIVFVLGIPLFLPKNPYTFCYFCPSGTLESAIPWASMAHWKVTPGMFNGFTAKFLLRIFVLAGTLGMVVFISRGFCRVFCPLGAIFGLFNKVSLFRFNLAHKKCNSCGGCAKVCPVEIDPVAEMNTAECIRCYDCTRTKHIKMGVK